MPNLRRIPSIEKLRQRPSMRELESLYGRAVLVDALRVEAAAARARLATDDGSFDVVEAIEGGVAARITSSLGSLKAVINATGVIIHTNLGRAPLSAEAAWRVARLALGYTNLEYDLARGQRGRRDVHAEELIRRLTGAAAAVVVNNNAAATLLTLAALASGREVLISRGELVEIGGGFRVPDVMAQSGALLREVGTTNRTRAADYAASISDRTAMILRVHPSNFRQEGFVERPPLDALVALGRRFSIPVVEDLGSGYLGTPEGPALREEPVVSTSLQAGVDLVLFSGDKLLGGPQAGIIAGTEAAVSPIRRHPLMRALRVDKMTYAALEATLEAYAAGRAEREVPVAWMIASTIEEITRRAEAVGSALLQHGFDIAIVDGFSTIGGGSAPGSTLPTRLVSVRRASMSATELEAALRATDPPVIARIENDRVMLDLRTVLPDQDELLANVVVSLVRGRETGRDPPSL